MFTDLEGQLLIAMPGMEDPRFAQSVVFLCAHSRDGAMGLIVNKPMPGMRFSELLEQLDITPAADLPDVRVQFGGPVASDRGFVLHTMDQGMDSDTMSIADDVGMTSSVDILQTIADGKGPRQAMLALGYAGWGPGQLETELARNDWLTSEASPEILFGRAFEHKWSAAVKSIGVDPSTLSGTAGRA